ncbi:MAG: hypothetical protein ACK5XQ_09995 [Flavobacteriales bacterium]
MNQQPFEGTSKVTIVLDGEQTTFDLSASGETILNAALDKGLDAP